jgi:hypothetical protein
MRERPSQKRWPTNDRNVLNRKEALTRMCTRKSRTSWRLLLTVRLEFGTANVEMRGVRSWSWGPSRTRKREERTFVKVKLKSEEKNLRKPGWLGGEWMGVQSLNSIKRRNLVAPPEHTFTSAPSQPGSHFHQRLYDPPCKNQHAVQETSLL